MWCYKMAAAVLGKTSWAARVPENSPLGLKFLLLFKPGVTRHLLGDLEQKKLAALNQTNCSTESPAALAEAKVSLTLPTT